MKRTPIPKSKMDFNYYNHPPTTILLAEKKVCLIKQRERNGYSMNQSILNISSYND